MPDPLSQDVWFLIWRKRYWAIRRQGDILTMRLVATTIILAIVGFLLAGFVHWVVGVVFALIGVVLSQWQFNRVIKKHTNFTMTLEEWKQRRAGD